MKCKGGYNVYLSGRPVGAIQKMPEPERLYVPLCSARLNFSALCVKDKQRIHYGECLARDPDLYDLPLLAPRTGTVSLSAAEHHIVLNDLDGSDNKISKSVSKIQHVDKRYSGVNANIAKLVPLGAWQFFSDAHTGDIPDPLGKPQAVVVNTVSIDPFMVRGDVLLRTKLLNFTRGLEQLQTLLEYQPIYLVIPRTQSEFATLVKKQIRGYAWVKIVEVLLIYPHSHLRLIVWRLGIKPSAGSVWGLDAQGVFAIDTALTAGQPCVKRIIAVGGPEVTAPSHMEVVTGYPIEGVCDVHVRSPLSRIINGGILTGHTLDEKIRGVDTECKGLTVLPELEEREFLDFVRPGWAHSCYAPCYLSSLRKRFRERFTTGVRGEGRPCVSCRYCEEVCPAGIMPPMKNIIYSIYDRWPERTCWLFFGCRATRDIFYLKEFQALAEKHPGFHVVYALSDELGPDEQWDGETGFIHLSVDKYLEPDIPRQAFLCGPPLMIEAVTRVLRDKGIAPEDIFYDEF